MKNGVFNLLGSFTLCIVCNSAFSAEVYNPNPFTPPPVAANNVVNKNINNVQSNNERQVRRLDNKNIVNKQTSTVTELLLTEKEIRSNKILETINSKMANAKNIPIENSRYVGVINGKRIYQHIETNEYVKVDIENN